jgi:hypothetical protein
MLDDRAFHLHCARVMLAECAHRRHSWVNRNFYWSLFAFAQQERRAAARATWQAGLFG